MNLENQVCSLELAQKLKWLRTKQNSLFYWIGHNDDWILDTKSLLPSFEKISAFTVVELGEMLSDKYAYTIRFVSKNLCRIQFFETINKCNSFEGTEANARARMLIYLLESKLI
jgi:hypothetical protein